jgi:nicotinamide phosphoribosyltransferase
MCSGGKDDEIGTFRRLLETYPTGILSVVSDTWDLWKVCTEHVVTLKEEIMARDGKLVIRPDSGNPADILCGLNTGPDMYHTKIALYPAYKGVIELLWDVFGGTINEQGYKVLDPHIGAIYGDSITIERAEEICKRLEDKGFASTNVVLGIGSFTYQYNTRDTFGFAMKATYVEVNGEAE